ncbi:hypothetical protein RVR_2798 [Actinacidiphila reveromycinica]|uniref:Uncharacterized protein n=1 Tax=Actinacidiphila reveromycinica TaxID=659352 RepID=A0A7U3UQY7_9ACTN|nr:hypothetical protein [Streptomyces sp. SN-593]BBA97172.1 hypothetical protein RVR_2798 [Streptomyces sp. SN-593]
MGSGRRGRGDLRARLRRRHTRHPRLYDLPSTGPPGHRARAVRATRPDRLARSETDSDSETETDADTDHATDGGTHADAGLLAYPYPRPDPHPDPRPGTDLHGSDSPRGHGARTHDGTHRGRSAADRTEPDTAAGAETRAEAGAEADH